MPSGPDNINEAQCCASRGGGVYVKHLFLPTAFKSTVKQNKQTKPHSSGKPNTLKARVVLQLHT
jgi:hypothetical protein